MQTKATKAIWAGIIAATGGLATALVDNAITWAEFGVVAATTATAVGAVYGVTNHPKES